MKKWSVWGILALVSGFSSAGAQTATPSVAVFGGGSYANFLSLSGHVGAELNFGLASGVGFRVRGLGELSSVGNAQGTALNLDGLFTFEGSFFGQSAALPHRSQSELRELQRGHWADFWRRAGNSN